MRAFLLLILASIRTVLARHDHNYLAHHYQHYHQYQTHEPPTDLSIWISEQQVKVLSGYSLRIFAIENGRVSHFLRDPAFDSYLPMIPPEVSYVNFTWTAGQKKYRYHFDQMTSLNEEILQPPIISIKSKGKIPQEPKRKASFINLVMWGFLFQFYKTFYSKQLGIVHNIINDVHYFFASFKLLFSCHFQALSYIWTPPHVHF